MDRGMDSKVEVLGKLLVCRIQYQGIYIPLPLYLEHWI